MANYIARGLGVCLAFDTTFKFDLVSAKRMRAATWQGRSFDAVLRYLSLGNPNFNYDISPSERDALFEAGFKGLGLVQHVNMPSWQANPQNGSQHGKAAASHARLVSAPSGADLCVDMEGLGDPGAQAEAYLQEWLKPVQDAGFNLEGGAEYEGYLDGILSLVRRRALYDARTARKFFSDFGHREPLPGIGFVMVQHPQTNVDGFIIDPDDVRPADDGAEFQFMCLDTGDAVAPDAGDPVAQPAA